MDYIDQLIETIKKLNSKIIELKNNQDSQEADQEVAENYYDRYLKVNQENLKLKEKIAELELSVSIASYKLEEKAKEVQKYKKQLIGMTL